jgi:hypothetical protein
VTLSKQLIEVGAIFVGGCWTYTKFIRTEAPAEQQNFIFEQQMKWVGSPQTSACYAILGIDLQNISKSEVHIEKATQRAWLLPLPNFDQRIAFVDPDQLIKSPPTESLTYTDGAFIQNYAPLAKVHYDLVWTLRRAPGLALFRVDLFTDSSDTEPTDWVYDWDEICGGGDASKVSPKKKHNPIEIDHAPARKLR